MPEMIDSTLTRTAAPLCYIAVVPVQIKQSCWAQGDNKHQTMTGAGCTAAAHYTGQINTDRGGQKQKNFQSFML